MVAATRDVERGRTTPDVVDRRFDEDREELLRLQRDVGLDLLSDGLLRWQDLFRPLVDASKGLEARGLVRWFDNNAFYRAPQVTGALGLDRGLPPVLSEDGISEPRVGTLPSPYLFSRAVTGPPEDDRDDLMVGLGRDLLAPVAAGLAERGARLIHLEEPWIPARGIEGRSWEPFGRAVGAIREAIGDRTRLVVHAYFGDAAPHAAGLRALPVDAVGIDFVQTELTALPAPWNAGLVVGCLDGRRSIVEDPVGTASFIERVAEALDPPTLFIAPATDLELAGRDVADRKVRVLGEAARRIREAA